MAGDHDRRTKPHSDSRRITRMGEEGMKKTALRHAKLIPAHSCIKKPHCLETAQTEIDVLQLFFQWLWLEWRWLAAFPSSRQSTALIFIQFAVGGRPCSEDKNICARYFPATSHSSLTMRRTAIGQFGIMSCVTLFLHPLSCCCFNRIKEQVTSTTSAFYMGEEHL